MTEPSWGWESPRGRNGTGSRRLRRHPRQPTAGAKPSTGAGVGREVAAPGGGAAAVRPLEESATAQQLPPPLAALSADQIPILLPVQLGQTPAVHQPAGPVEARLLGSLSLAATTKGGAGVTPRPTAIQRVAEMERCGGPRPAGPSHWFSLGSASWGTSPLPSFNTSRGHPPAAARSPGWRAADPQAAPPAPIP